MTIHQIEQIFTGPNKNQYAAKIIGKQLQISDPTLVDRIEVLGGNFKKTVPYIKVELRLDGSIPIIYKIEFTPKTIDEFPRIRYDKSK